MRFVKGAYKGKTGFLDSANNRRGDNVYVFVENGGVMKHTFVKFTSIRSIPPAPKTWAEAALQQVNGLEPLLVKLAAEFAKCDIQDHDHEIIEAISTEFQLAMKQQEELSKPTWYRVRFGERKGKSDKRTKTSTDCQI